MNVPGLPPGDSKSMLPPAPVSTSLAIYNPLPRNVLLLLCGLNTDILLTNNFNTFSISLSKVDIFVSVSSFVVSPY